MANKINDNNTSKSTVRANDDQQQSPRHTFRDLRRKLMHMRLQRNCPSPKPSKQLAAANTTTFKHPQNQPNTAQLQTECGNQVVAEAKSYKESSSPAPASQQADNKDKATDTPVERSRINPAAFRFQASLRMSVDQDFFHEADIIHVKYPRCPASQSVESNSTVDDFSRGSTNTVLMCH